MSEDQVATDQKEAATDAEYQAGGERTASPYSLINDAIEFTVNARKRAQDSDTHALYSITIGKLLEACRYLLKAQKSFRSDLEDGN